MTPSGIEPATFRFVAQYLSHCTTISGGTVDNTKLDLRYVGCGGMDWIELAQDRNRWQAVVNEVMNHRVPQNAGNFLTS
jgi:hypothetical protein